MAKLASQTYNIARPTGRCAATGAPLEPGAPYVAALVESADAEGFERHDYSIDGWSRSRSQLSGLFGHWRAVMREPGVKPKLFLDDGALVELFHQSDVAPGAGAAGADVGRQAFRYVLALVLLRKRLLRHAGTAHRGGSPVLLVRARGSSPDQPALEVHDPGMDEASVALAAERLGAALRGER